ncbi:unnamed protein product [Cuscuta campestris]|uniref:Retroviral polymerase SH3-like domain-containing protein n=1 Tax=Cuscuta campestris TaxID=132261 RepID=A0A484L550_9ASTE|nr:unnamed protein product [Cuscuta campestris]
MGVNWTRVLHVHRTQMDWAKWMFASSAAPPSLLRRRQSSSGGNPPALSGSLLSNGRKRGYLQHHSGKNPSSCFYDDLKRHVPVLLSLSQPNYKKWSCLFLLLVRRFNLQGYIYGSIVPLSEDNDEWLQLDALLQGWILSTISDEVSDLVISSVSTASALWKVIHDLFHGNKNARAMQLEHEFCTTVKGNTTMAAYCQHLQNLTDWLNDVVDPMSQHQLVLQMLRGLPADLLAQTSFLQFQDPLPTFLQARSALMLLDRQRSPMAEAGGTALLAGRPGGNGGGRQSSSGSCRGSQHGGSGSGGFHGGGLQHGGSYGESGSFGQRNGYVRGGYHPTTKGNKCYEPVSQKVYVSRHVRFVEDQFPYPKLSSLPSPSPITPIFPPSPGSHAPVPLTVQPQTRPTSHG